MTENDVVETVATHLETLGYRIDKKLTTQQRGVDIEGTHVRTGRRILIEAKGGTSSKPGTKRYGKSFSSGQALSHVSRAFFTASRLLQKYSADQACVALALPGDTTHRALVSEISQALTLLRVCVFFVDATGRVDLFGRLSENDLLENIRQSSFAKGTASAVPTNPNHN